MSKTLRGKGVQESLPAFWIKLVARRCGATDVMSPTKTTPSVARHLLQRLGVGTKVSSGSPRKGFRKRVAAPIT